jgi:aldose 1-epimerase
VHPESFGTLRDGRQVDAWTLGGPGGLQVRILTFGARIAAIDVPGADGPRRVTLGHDNLAGYESDTAHLGGVVGRVGNRIAGGRFWLDGREVQVSVNNGPNMLHGGKVGFDQAVWQAAANGEAVLLTHVSADGDQGFPGMLTATVRYAVEGDALVIDYAARSDAPTVVNLTNHAYFNLDGSADVLGHTIGIAAETFLPTDAGQIPTGERRQVAGTPFDFRTPHPIGARIGDDDEQLRIGHGYDHNFVLAGAPRTEPAPAATVRGRGMTMEVLTTEPGVQFYSGNFLPKAGWPLRAALCLETQHFPDAPNHADFPSIVLRPGEARTSRTIYRFVAG